MNQGMMMESFNLSVVWNLPVLFVCKNDGWAITTVSPSVTGGDILERAKSFGMPAAKVNGSDVAEMWDAASAAFGRMRKKPGPFFIHASCIHPEGHFLGDPLLRIQKNPVGEIRKLAGPMIRSAVSKKGASIAGRTGGLGRVGALIGKTAVDRSFHRKDPVKAVRKRLDSDRNRLESLEGRVIGEVEAAAALADRP
jgi:pyruvate dehydrogenase E1 component alpha subunit